MAESAISNTTSTAVHSSINGDSFSDAMQDQFQNILVGALGNLGAKEIGSAAHGSVTQNQNGTYTYNAPSIGKANQLALHVGLGCAMGLAGGNDCASGAVSGVVGEITAEYLGKNTNLNNNQIKELSGLSGGLSAIFTSNAVGLEDQQVADNIFSGQRIGKNAAENNYLTGKIFGKETEEKLDKLLNDIRGNSLDQISDKYVASNDVVEKAGLFAILVTGQGLPSSTTELELMILTAGASKAFAPQIAIGLSKVDDAASGLWGKLVGKSDEVSALTPSSSVNSVLLKNQLTAEEITTGHALGKHLDEFSDMGITTQKDLQNYVETVLNNKAADVRYTSNGKTYYLDHDNKTLVILNPNAPDGSTVFRPNNWQQYISTNIPSKKY